MAPGAHLSNSISTSSSSSSLLLLLLLLLPLAASVLFLTITILVILIILITTIVISIFFSFLPSIAVVAILGGVRFPLVRLGVEHSLWMYREVFGSPSCGSVLNPRS